jgi:dTDP-4-dehydrorhamnose 3,5-epimerase
MKPSTTSLPGVRVFDADDHLDPRGSVAEVYRRDRYSAFGIEDVFVQDNIAVSVRGALRGLHYRLSPQAKLVMVVHGEIYAVAVDVRRGSPTFAQWFGTLLAAETRRQLYIPPGFAHGYQAVADGATVLYKLSAVFDPTDDRAVRSDDPALAIPWPLTDPVVSERDRAAPLLVDAELPAYVP